MPLPERRLAMMSEQIVALLKRIRFARTAGNADTAAVELQHIEACLGRCTTLRHAAIPFTPVRSR
jgi:hypothetical protein